MYSLIQLTTNEWLKLTKKKSFYILLALVVIIAVAVASFIYFVIGKDFLSAGTFGRGLISINGGGYLYLVLSIIVASAMVSKEHQQGTIKLLLIRGHSRNLILASKFIATLVYMVVLGLFTLLVSYTVGILFFHNDGGLQIGQAVAELAYTFIYTFSFVVIALMCSTLLKSTGATIGIALSLTFVEGIIVGLLYNYKYAKYILFFNTNFGQYANGGSSMVEGLTSTFSAIIYGVYMIIFIAITFIVFKKRDVA